MSVQIILSDHNCEGQAEAIFDVLRYQGYTELLSIDLLFFPDVGLDVSAEDEIVWRLCQEKGYLLITGNRTASDGARSLEFTIRRLLREDSLPVITIANLRRINSDLGYCQLCAEKLADTIFDLDKYAAFLVCIFLVILFATRTHHAHQSTGSF